MCRNLTWILVSVCALAALAAPAFSQQPPTAKLLGDLPRVLDQAQPEELIPVYFVLKDQLDTDRLVRQAARSLTQAERRDLVIHSLEAHARTTQENLIEQIRTIEKSGKGARVRPLWIGNVVGADLRREDILRLAALPEIARVNWNPKRDVSLTPRESSAPAPVSPLDAYRKAATLAEIECGVQKMGAPQVWNELGNTGKGAVVALIDSGVCWTHTDIINQIWVNPGEDINHNGVVMDAADLNGIDDDGNGFVDDLIGWDFDQNDNQPSDDNSHGSHCAGTIAGDGTGGFQAGMAPDARIMVIRVGLSFSDEVDVWNGMQYAAQNHADTISMSLGWPHSNNPDRATWRTNCENTINAGTAMVIAAGNEGSGSEPDNLRTPGDVPRVISVGATDCNDQAAGFSSRGPVSWSNVAPFNDWPYPPGLVKPDIAAPGVDTKSHDVCSGYSFKSGTSMATPHVAGAVALMVAANPGLEHDEIKEILESTAVPLGDPGKDNTFGSGRVDVFAAVQQCATPDGRVSIKEKAVACSGTIHITVSDSDLRGTGTLTVNAASPTEPGGEPVVLVETGSSGVFKGQIDNRPGAPAADGTLQISGGDTITVTYIDADNGAGGTQIPKTATALVDCAFPLISAVRTDPVGLTSATIRWTTDEPSSSSVDYGATVPPGQAAGGNANTTEHQVALTGLNSCTVYYFQVTSIDGPGNSVTDNNGGAYFHFETLADFGNGPQSCHGGRARLDRDVYSCADTITVEVSDSDLNRDSAAIDTATLLVTSTTEITPEVVTVTETGPNTSRFTGTILSTGGAAARDGKIEAQDGDTLTLTYLDADDGTGAPAVSFANARFDCTGPVISNIRVEAITDQRATLRFTTNEPGNTVVEWGPTPALGKTSSSAELTQEHAILVNQFKDCERGYFRVRSTDTHGYTTTADNNGQPFAFSLGLIPGLYWRETFEDGGAGWTLNGEWQVGAPQGKGGSSGRPDPTSAYNNQKVLGEDLTGLGAFPGDYEPNIYEAARSPRLDSTSWKRTKLIIHRRLQAGGTDDANIMLWTTSGVNIFRNDGTPYHDTDFVVMAFDVQKKVDGAPQTSLEFRMRSDGSGQFSGWNVDDVIFKDGALPDYQACGACGAAPSFAGAVTAVDNDACGAAGVTVSWNPAVAWGSGNLGTYALYRDTAPGFTPTAANLVAKGISGLSFNDTAAPEGTTLYYLVRAESDETCAAGPNNGGMTDGNTVYLPVSNTGFRPLPGTIDTLAAELIAETNLRLTWSSASGATSYRIYRSNTPLPGSFLRLGETSHLYYEDNGQGALKENAFYLVRGANPCGQETP